MKCKEIAFTLPLMLIMLEGMLFRGRLLKKPIVLILGGALLLIVPLQMLLLQWRGGGAEEFLQWLQRATTEAPFISRHDYFLTQLRVVVTYMRLLLFPAGQNLDHDYPLYRSILNPQVLAAIFVHLVMAALTIGLVLRSRLKLSRGDNGGAAALRLCAAGICWFYLALSVESSFIPIRDYIYEHRLYLPSVGFFLALMTGVAYPVAARMALRKPLCWIMVFVCCLLSAATVARNHVWRSEMSLWQDALAKSPAKARPYHSIGKLYYLRWKPESAVPYLLRSIELDPNKALYRITLNQCLGLLKRLEGRTADGLRYQKGRDEVDERSLTPWLTVSYNNLGLAYEEFSGNLFLARKNYEISVSLDPQFDLGWYNLALVTTRQGDRAASSAALERLRAVNPGLAGAAAATGYFTPPADQQKRVLP
jgi:tetratricopeptide (TPR) repeat protein